MAALIRYEDREFRADTLAIIDQARTIMDEYVDAGYVLTLRQLYYQFVARDLLANRQREYKRLGSIVANARMAGLLDWEAMEDRTRNLESPTTWDDPADILQAARDGYQEDLWDDQPYRVEVWVEKDALLGVLDVACGPWRLPYTACRGYMSQSELWQAAMRHAEYAAAGQQVVVLHLGDHDPSGLDMTRDLQDRLDGFTLVDTEDGELGGRPWPGSFQVEVRRIALNMDQVRHHRPPPNPAKMTDSRATGYVDRFGTQSWELDALPPDVISALVRDEVDELLDHTRWKAAKALEQGGRDKLGRLIDQVRGGE